MLCSAAMRRTTGEIGGLCSSGCASPGDAPVSIVASSAPTSTVAPTSTSSDVTRPVAGDGTSVSTLSVEISTIGSSASLQSPPRLFHSPTVPHPPLPLHDGPLGGGHAHLRHRDLGGTSKRGAHGTPPSRCRPAEASR